jgi:predicted DCC family thiol-disulfide oxidoreductase YuxK
VEQKIVFYDGDCGLCNKSVQLILKKEKSAELNFCALQSDVAQEFFVFKSEPAPDLSTLIFYDGRSFSYRSTAVLRIASYLKFPANWIRIGWFAPVFLRDFIYRQIAQRRNKMFKSQCFLPSIEQRVRFLTQKWW